jgi:hypothetical protein
MIKLITVIKVIELMEVIGEPAGGEYDRLPVPGNR